MDNTKSSDKRIKNNPSTFPESKLKWKSPKVSVIEISKLTKGFSPRFKDLPLPGLGATS